MHARHGKSHRLGHFFVAVGLAAAGISTPLLPAIGSADAAGAPNPQSIVDISDAAAARADDLIVASEARLAAAKRTASELHRQLDALNSKSATTVTSLAEARKVFRQHAVDAFVSQEHPESVMILFGGESVFDASARSSLTVQTVERTASVVKTFETQRARTAPKLADLAEAVDRADAGVQDASNAVLAARSTAGEIERQRDAATAKWARARAVDRGPEMVGSRSSNRTTRTPGLDHDGTTTTNPPVTTPPGTVPPVTAPPVTAPPGGPTEHQWYLLRMCESTNNYQAVSSSGKYRGAYQFDRPTWATLGSPGDPAAAAPAEQDRRAKLLYSRRGWKPWPVCGKYLI